MTGRASTAAKVGMKHAAERAPIWVIAVMAHLVVAAILGITYIRHDVPNGHETPETSLVPLRETPKLDDVMIVDIPRHLRDIPRVDAPDDEFSAPPPRIQAAPSSEPDTIVPAGSPRGDGAGAPAPFAGGTGGVERPGPTGFSATSRLAPRGASNPRVLRSQPFRPKVEPLLMEGLRWLREHQSEDGAWDCDGFALRCDPKRDPACSGPGSGNFDAGVTGLAILAFLGAGHDGLGPTQADEVVRKGLRWLRNAQDAEGCFGPRIDERFTYAHACATIAMCEAAAFNKGHVWRKSAQAAIDFIQSSQKPYGGWRYGVRPNESDASVTGWMLLGLKAGKDAGLVVSERSIRDGLLLLDRLTDVATGRTGYQQQGDLPVRPPGLTDRWPARESESLTAVALCARIFLGDIDDPLNASGGALISAKPPAWDETTGSIDMYYWYYGTLAMHQLGGAAWERWNERLEKVIAQNQIKDGCAAGSWDPEDPWGPEGGRVYATALMTLCLEVQWRYPRVFGARK